MVREFCTICSNKLEKIKESLFHCPSCGQDFYINPCPSNGVILLNEKDEILFVKRKVPPNENTWDLPGGFMDINESAEESVTRELWEELKIKITDFKYFKSYPDRYQFQKINYYTLMFVYVAHIPDQKFITASPRPRYFSAGDEGEDELKLPTSDFEQSGLSLNYKKPRTKSPRKLIEGGEIKDFK